MGNITVWTKQHKSVAETLEQKGRYTAKKEIVLNNEEVKLQIHAYSWLMKAHPDLENKPCDADFPVWVSFRKSATMLLSPDTVILELSLDESIITKLNIMKWTKINNLAYIPSDSKDERRHRELLSLYGVSDAKACMTNFYPEIRKEVENSWQRAFDASVDLGNESSYGLIWEIKREWLKNIIR